MKIFALDIGQSNIKAILLDSSFGKVELSQYWIEPIIDAGTPIDENERKILTSNQIDTLTRILSTPDLKFDRCAVFFPRGWNTSRVFIFPTKDKKAISKTLEFELDDEVPFSMDQILYDYIVHPIEGSSSKVYAALCLKKDLIDLISQLNLIVLDPDFISNEAWAFSQFVKRSLPKDYHEKPIAFLQLGETRSTIHFMIGSQPLYSHHCDIGGKEITQVLAKTYNIDFAQAEKIKTENGFVLTQSHFLSENANQITAEQKAFSDVLVSTLNPILREVRQSLLSFKSQNNMFPKALFITGGSSQLQNLSLFLQEQLALPVFPFHYISTAVGETLKLSENTESMLSAVFALGASCSKIEKSSTINFRKDEFAKSGGASGFQWKPFIQASKYMGATAAFVLINSIAQNYLLDSALEKQEAKFEKAVKSVLGAVSNSTLSTYKNSPSALKSALQKELAKYKDQKEIKVKPVLSGFDLLNKISAQTSKDITLDVSSFEFSDGKVKISGVTPQMSDAQRFLKTLEDSRLLKDVKKDKIEQNIKSKNFQFEFSATVIEDNNG